MLKRTIETDSDIPRTAEAIPYSEIPPYSADRWQQAMEDEMERNPVHVKGIGWLMGLILGTMIGFGGTVALFMAGPIGWILGAITGYATVAFIFRMTA